MKKKSKPVDSTMRNVRAANRRISFLEHRIDTLCAALNDLRDLHNRLQGDFLTLDAWVVTKLNKKQSGKRGKK